MYDGGELGARSSALDPPPPTAAPTAATADEEEANSSRGISLRDTRMIGKRSDAGGGGIGGTAAAADRSWDGTQLSIVFTAIATKTTLSK